MPALNFSSCQVVNIYVSNQYSAHIKCMIVCMEPNNMIGFISSITYFILYHFIKCNQQYGLQ